MLDRMWVMPAAGSIDHGDAFFFFRPESLEKGHILKAQANQER